MEAKILKFICANQGAVDAEELMFNLFPGQSTDEVISNQSKFALCSSNGKQRVVARTSLRLCRKKDCPGTCGELHLCRNFLYTGSCHFLQRRGCSFPHVLNSDYNQRLLEEHELEGLSRAELCTLLLQSDNTILPAICFDYNNGDGEFGRCTSGLACERLHICQKSLTQSCSCSRAHDFTAFQPKKVLHDKMVPDDMLRSLRSVYVNREALRLHMRRGSGRARRGNLIGAAGGQEGNGAGDQKGRQKNKPVKDKTEICMYFIKGYCKHDDKCFKAHDKMPYRWQVQEGGQWKALPDNETIEKEYCDPSNTYSSGSPPVHFDTMTRGGNKVRRLTTVNSLVEPTFIHTTEWLWYWQDEFGKWNLYGPDSAGRKSSDIRSETLEQKFLDNESEVEFSAGSQSYSLSFQDMIQTNKHYRTKRLVSRRPLFVSAADVRTKKVRKPPAIFSPVPDHWDKTQIPPTGFSRVAVPRTSDEFQKIEARFHSTLRGFDIVKIERIQNKALWEVFQLQKTQMKNNNSGREVEEKQLFHGTDSKHINAICLNNFDWRICGVNGTAYGKGSYFARDAKYSHSYTGDSDVKTMFVSRVLVGSYTKGDSSYVRPPSKDGGVINFYDSCVNDIANPSIFVVFEKHQIYPEYLLTYKTTQPLVDRYSSASMYQGSTASNQGSTASNQGSTASNQANSSDNSCLIA
ncbi:protein mono-ADP-ribosyltransferase PARP12 isoform X5 [Gambusia affinis]|uniref:protein mono-ADP-ribosyltransferase PARP12 isoform X5 n=1 Tax=Gambusia affinis TaxID=33528 RepID=UPI001CDC60FC|nr:protein mono-ADP-ribosyltransferase PARP12 isoform X5 [Gambusia affinis]